MNATSLSRGSSRAHSRGRPWSSHASGSRGSMSSGNSTCPRRRSRATASPASSPIATSITSTCVVRIAASGCIRRGRRASAGSGSGGAWRRSFAASSAADRGRAINGEIDPRRAVDPVPPGAEATRLSPLANGLTGGHTGTAPRAVAGQHEKSPGPPGVLQLGAGPAVRRRGRSAGDGGDSASGQAPADPR